MVRLIAKGAKRPKSKTGGAIDLLAEGDLVFSTGRGESLGTLMEFSESISRGPLRRDAGRLSAALYAIELTGAMLAEGDPLPEAFDLLRRVLARLTEPDAPAPAVLAYFQWRLLRHVGLLGELSACVSCGRDVGAASGRAPRDVYFSSSLGGLLCGGCEIAQQEKCRVDSATLAGLAALSAVRSGTRVPLPDAQAHAVNRLLAYHVTCQIGKPPKMARHVIPPAPHRRSD